ncbi:MAG: hypothetical protein ACRCWS_00445, partial [Propionibacteriaceae bacterium]
MTTTPHRVTRSTETSAATAVVAPRSVSAGLRSRINTTPTPRLLSRLRLLCILLLLVFGVSASLAIREAHGATENANQATEQYNRVYDISAHVMAAHAAATHDLAAGTALDAQYRTEMTQAYQQITAAAVAVPDDRDDLAALTEQLQNYDDAIRNAAIARASTNQAASTTQAATAQSIAETHILPTVDRIAHRNRDELSAKGTAWLLL